MNSMQRRLFLEERVGEYLKSINTQPRDHILIACSGGPDSTCLLHLLSALRDAMSISISVGYLDHGIRERFEITGDIEFLKALTEKLLIPFYVEHVQPGFLKEIALKQGRSLEEVARKSRYGFLEKVSQRVSSDFIALGHTADDQVETLIMRFFQGVGYAGLAGIPPERGRIIRPLINCSRQEILTYLEDRGLFYRTDSTNSCQDFLRNRVRSEFVPLIVKIFPGYCKSLLSLAGKMREIRDFLISEVETRVRWEKADSSRTIFRIDGSSFIKCPPLLRLQSLYNLFQHISPDSGKNEDAAARIPYRFLKPVLNDAWFFPKRVLARGYGIKLSWKGEDLFFERDIVSDNKKGYLIFVGNDTEYRIEDIGSIFRREVHSNAGIDAEGLIIKAENVLFPLIVRSRRAGDAILIQGGRKSLKKLFNEWGVPAEIRWKIPVVADRRGILGILGRQMGFYDRGAARGDIISAGYGSGAAGITITFKRMG